MSASPSRDCLPRDHNRPFKGVDSDDDRRLACCWDTDRLAGTIKHWVVNPRAVAMISVLA
jgi:hypothetical protein